MRLVQNLTAILAVSALLGAGAARADDSALNKEGVWTVGRGSAKSEACMASAPTKDGMLILQATAGRVTFGVGSRAKMRTGRKGVLATDAYRFDFTPGLDDDRTLMLANEDLDDRAVAALKLAKDIVVQLDGKPVLDAHVDGTGLEGALEAMIACSKGERGWWGPGVEAPPAAEPAATGPGGLVMNKEGLWGIVRADKGAVCVAQASIHDGRFLQVLAAEGRLGLAVGAEAKGSRLPKGRAANVETDGYAFTFVPQYDDTGRYMNSAEPLDDVAVGILRKAGWIRVAVDRKVVADVALEGSGFSEVLDAVAACSRGEKGWWGEGAKAG